MSRSLNCRALARTVALTVCLISGAFAGAVAQEPGGWSTNLDRPPQPPAQAPQAKPAAPGASEPAPAPGTTVVKKKASPEAETPDTSQVRLVALLTADGQRIEQDIVWRIFEESPAPGTAGKLIATHNEASPLVRLKPGTYTVNAAFGRAYLTRKVTVATGIEKTEPFVLNAGGLRLKIVAAGHKLEAAKARYDILTDERDQSGDRKVVLGNAKPGVIVRLNSGIYHIISTLGDANASVEADVTVEAGKLTEAAVTHKAGRVTLKLVTRAGGEAQPDTEWSLLTEEGQPVKTSVGALPTHVLAPGRYLAVAKSQGKVFRKSFAVADGDAIQVEVVQQ